MFLGKVEAGGGTDDVKERDGMKDAVSGEERGGSKWGVGHRGKDADGDRGDAESVEGEGESNVTVPRPLYVDDVIGVDTYVDVVSGVQGSDPPSPRACGV